VSRHAISLSALPPHLRAQAEAQLGVAPTPPVAPAPLSHSSPVPSHPKRRGPNRTESLFRTLHLHGLNARYEGLTFPLPGGARYTPDWVVWDCPFAPGKLACFEVKGYRLHSEGRAYTAWTVAAEVFADFATFFWFTKLPGKDEFVQKHARRTVNNLSVTCE
jgi:hypothetical protein